MAEKQNKKNRVMDVLFTEHKWENLVLAILAIFAIELGVLLLTKNYLTIPADAFLIGKYWKVFSWVLVVLGAVSLILSVSSFYAPSFAEIKNISGLKKKEFFGNVLKVFIFSVVLALFFLLCDFVIETILNLF
ncbi:MAG: preprotein translocase subunit SecE [Bacilli bacterium]